MSLINRLKGAWRGLSAASGGLSDLRHPTAWVQDTWGGMRTTAGVAVTPSTSLTVGAYYRAIALVSASVAKMPVRVVRVIGDRREVVDGHAIARLLSRRPNSETSAWDFTETMTQWALAHGNALAIIDRDRNANPVDIWQRPPGEIRLMEDSALSLGDEMRVYYEWNNLPGSGRNTILMRDDVLHVKGMGTGMWGYSVAQFMARTTGESIAQGEHAGAFFGNAARPGGILSHPGPLKAEARENLRKSFEALYQGSGNAYKTMVLEEGAKWDPLTMPMEDAQFLEQRKFSVTEIARWFGIPPHKLADLEHATFSNIEHLSIEYVQDAVMPWACRWESETLRKLLGPRSGSMEIDYDESALIRGDSVQRAERTRTAISTGVMTPNEGRIELGMNPSDGKGMDEFYIQGAMATVEAIADPPEPPPPVMAAPPPASPDDAPDDTPEPPPAPEPAAVEPAPPIWAMDEDAVSALFLRCSERLTRQETNALARDGAGMKPDAKFVKWANAWYSHHRAAARSEFAALFALFGTAKLPELDRELDGLHVSALSSSLEHYRAGDLAEWIESYEPERAASMAATFLAIARGRANVEA